MKKGYVHVYTGNGKGKSTAAFGQAVRSAGAGLEVYIGQFCKSGIYSELRSVKKISNITVEQFGRGCFVKRKPDLIDIDLAKRGFSKIKEIISGDIYDVVILDEICVALHFGLIKTEEVISLIRNKPARTELIITGRKAPKRVIDAADLVTEMKEIKHYYSRGVKARKGIEC